VPPRCLPRRKNLSRIPRSASGRGRTETDPYQAGLETVAARLRAQLDGALFAVAYHEFCTPTLEESVEELIKKSATSITVTTTMFAPGESHSEVEIREILEQLRQQYPDVVLRYAWPFDLLMVVKLLQEQVAWFS
jgi:sirohydrochlorin cobaltochelatase